MRKYKTKHFFRVSSIRSPIKFGGNQHIINFIHIFMFRTESSDVNI